MFRFSDQWLLGGLTAACIGLAAVAYAKGLSEPLEAIGFVTGAVAVWLTVKEMVWNFPIGIVNSAAYVVVFWRQRLFADAGLNIFYVVLGFAGWWLWLHGGEKGGKLKVVRCPKKEGFFLATFTIIATVVLAQNLERIKDAAPFWDAFTTVLSVVGQYMVTRKYFENWHLWILANAIYVPLYAVKHLPLTSLLYLAFLIMAVVGLADWNVALRRRLAPNPAP